MINFKDKGAAQRFWEVSGNPIDFSPCLLWQLSPSVLGKIMNGFEGEGDVAEVGVFMGHFALCIAKHFRDRVAHLFDTFSGFPEGEICEHDLTNKDTCHEEGDFSETSINKVVALMDTHQCYNTIFHVGRFPDTAEQVKDKKFCFVSIDVDLYKPTKAAWEFFYPRMVEGGVIAMYDDYTAVACPGATKATDEFLQDKDELLRFDMINDNIFDNLVYIVKEYND